AAGKGQDMSIDKPIFLSYCHCAYKAFLKSTGAVGEVTEYELVQSEADDRFRRAAIDRRVHQDPGGRIIREPPTLTSAIEEGYELILGATAEALGVTLTCEMLERQSIGAEDRRAVYVPVLFSHRNKLAREDSLI